MKTPLSLPRSSRNALFFLRLATVLFLAGVAAVSGRAAEVGDLTGLYRCKGLTYEGTVTISRQGDAYRVDWAIGRERYSGVGLVQDGVLAVAYYGEMKGIVAYHIEDSGQLVGRWTTFAKPGSIGVETLTK